MLWHEVEDVLPWLAKAGFQGENIRTYNKVISRRGPMEKDLEMHLLRMEGQRFCEHMDRQG